MPKLNLDNISVPTAIKSKLKDLSKSIAFDKQSRKGGNGWLFFGTNQVHSQRVAVKFYDWGGDPKFHAEPKHLSTLNSDNIIFVMDAAFVDTDYAYFVTPFHARGDLDDELERGIIENLRAVAMTRDVLSGLSHLHAANLLHRDLKPQNLLLSDDDHAIIGDFGSVKHLPDGQTTVPGSGHSLIYRPPESVQTEVYGVAGDIYQVGVLLYQLLGGYLPYEESLWLNSQQLKKYRTISDPIDRQIFANDVIKSLIERGKIINISSLPPWVCTQLRRTISKACNIDPTKRFGSCSEFLAKMNSIRPNIRDWRVEEGCPTRHGKNIYRIIYDSRNGIYRVQKRGTGQWRFDNSFNGTSVKEIVKEIESESGWGRTELTS